MIELTEELRQALARGEPVRIRLDGHDLVLLQAEVYRRIKATLDAERAMIEKGPIRGPVALSGPLEVVSLDQGPTDLPPNVVALPGTRYEEIRELVEDERIRHAFREAGVRSAARLVL
jgi:hypothetical protein